jgi:O-6-methylguanine DNA methyltransferase
LNDSPLLLMRSTVETPLGPMMALASGAALCALEFSSGNRMTRLGARLDRWFGPYTIQDGSNTMIDRARRWLDDYFKGIMPANGPLTLDMRGHAFEQQVWRALREIPVGATSTYGAIARQLGSAGASRAVGLANGANPIAIIVPCHRVIGSNGTLTGYGGGLDKKRWLIDHERHWRTDRLF